MQTLLRNVEYFAAIAEHGQVQRAAAALGLTQPALSKSLRRLEASMKVKLLKRTPKGVELTSVGSALLARVGKLRLSIDDVMREIADLSGGRTGHLRICSAAGAALELVPAACAALLKESPKLTMKVSVDDTSSMLKAVRNGELDIAVAMGQGSRHADLVQEHYSEEVFEVHASARHRLAKRKQLSLADLVAERWILAGTDTPTVRVLSQAFADAGLPLPIIAVETTNLPLRHYMVATSDLLALGVRSTARHAHLQFGIVSLPLKDFSVARLGSVYYRKDAYLPPVAFRFIEILKTTAKKIASENR